MSIFKKATKDAARLRLALAGPSGSGKTYTALAVATAMSKADGSISRVALLDTEHASASKYADLFHFDTVSMAAPYHPDRFCKVIQAAAGEGYDVLIIDSLSHAWNGTGGILEIVDQVAARQRSSNSFAAWKEATPIHQRLIEALLGADIHLIATMRSKQEYALEKDGKGKLQVKKLGLAPIQRDGMEYEFDVFAELDMQHRLIVTKSRCPALSDAVIEKPGADLAATLSNWLRADTVAAQAA